MGKSRASLRIKQKVRGTKSHNKSEDLTRLTEQYNAFCKRLQGLVTALMNQHAAMLQLGKARFQVAQHLAVLSKDTVLYETTGQTPGADRSSDSVNSYFTIQEGVANKTKMYADKYKQFVVDYAKEWYKVITDRVGTDLKKAEKIRLELDHYQSKVENLRQSANATMAKGKQVDSKAAEKLTRNENKLIKIKESSSKFINNLCMLIEEITERSWRDLHPLLIKCAQFETQVSGDEAKAMAALNGVVSALKKVASDHGIKPQARLKDLQTVDPHVLSTRSKDDSRNLAIENGFAGMALGGSIAGSVAGSATSGGGGGGGDEYFPPGSTSAQGLGGFPVRVQSSDMSNGYDMGQSAAASASSNAAPSTMSMMNINAAPAPTMDTMANAFGQSASAPNSGGVPGYNNNNNSNINRNISADSLHSDFSGRSGIPAPAPAPSAAPPPPPPPPVGGDSMTGPPGGYNSAYGAPPGQYGAPAPAAQASPQNMMGGMMGGTMGGSSSYPQQHQHQQQQHQQQQQQPQQQQPYSGNFAQQQSMPANFAQQQSIYGGQQQQQPQPAPSSYGSSINTNPFG